MIEQRDFETSWCWAAVALAVALMAACGGDEVEGTSDTGSDAIGVGDRTGSETPDEPPDVLVGVDVTPDGGGKGGADDTAAPDDDADAAPDGPVCGSFADPCEGDGDCCSGYRIPATNGFECTDTCAGPCPEGYECLFLQAEGADPVSLCVDIAVHLCQPCADDGDCNEGEPQAPDACVDYGEAGSFCGLNCGAAGHSCPAGYACEELEGLPEATRMQCVLADEAEVCECSDVSVDLALATSCLVVNEVGACVGSRACGPDGLSECAGPEATAETCNEQDDDCDGETDEGLSGEPCTIENDDGECDGLSACEAGVAFCDAPIPAVDVCNGLDDDCDGLTDDGLDCCVTDAGCAHLNVPGTCDEASSCAGHRVDGVCTEAQVCEAVEVADAGPCIGAVCVAPACSAEGVWSAPTTCSVDGACTLGGAVEDCDDTNVCTVDVCDEATGCAHEPIDGDSTETCYTFEPETVGFGQCHAGIIGCNGGTSIGCVDQVGPTTETCNGLDDDCNGGTDEGGDDLCSPYVCLGEDGCLSFCEEQEDCEGGFFCDVDDLDDDGDSNECAPELGPGQTCHEDNHFECAGVMGCHNGFCCETEDGDCCADAGDCQHQAVAPACLVASVDGCGGERTDAWCGESNVCESATVDDIAACNGLPCVPGSCDGAIHTETLVCDLGGACAIGGEVQTCDDGNVCTTDSCDGEDGCGTEKIDGLTEAPCYSYAEDTADQGTCSSGVIACIDGVSDHCEGEVGPADEVCNGLDDDCDGETDDETAGECFPYACGGEDGCLDSCDTQDDCAADAYCDVGDVDGDFDHQECVPVGEDGAPCIDGNDHECASGYCGNGYCCGAEGEDCCGSILHCQHLATPAECLLATAGGCFGERVDAACDADHVCQATTVDDASACLDTVCTLGACAGLFLTEPKRCDAGGQCALGGGSEDCDDQNACTDDTCDVDAGCAHAPLDGPSETSCYTFEPAWTAAIGECHVGALGCDAGTPIGCVGQQGPATEVCNGVDDSCDGTTDEDGDAQCHPYFCLGLDGCGLGCELHEDCQDGHYCDGAACQPLIEAGDPCEESYECADLFCNAGYCCGSPTGQCCGSDNDCQNNAVAPSCDDASLCSGHRIDAFCNTASICQVQTVDDGSACAGSSCSAAVCVGMTANLGTVCDGEGSCSTSLGTQDCAGANTCCSYSCGGGACSGVFDNANLLCQIGCATSIISCDCY